MMMIVIIIIIILQLYFSRGSVLREEKHCWHFCGSSFFTLSWLEQNLDQEQRVHGVRADGNTDHENFQQTIRIWEKPILNDLSMFKFRVTKAWYPQGLSSELRQESFILV